MYEHLKMLHLNCTLFADLNDEAVTQKVYNENNESISKDSFETDSSGITVVSPGISQLKIFIIDIYIFKFR